MTPHNVEGISISFQLVRGSLWQEKVGVSE